MYGDDNCWLLVFKSSLALQENMLKDLMAT